MTSRHIVLTADLLNRIPLRRAGQPKIARARLGPGGHRIPSSLPTRSIQELPSDGLPEAARGLPHRYRSLSAGIRGIWRRGVIGRPWLMRTRGPHSVPGHCPHPHHNLGSLSARLALKSMPDTSHTLGRRPRRRTAWPCPRVAYHDPNGRHHPHQQAGGCSTSSCPSRRHLDARILYCIHRK